MSRDFIAVAAPRVTLPMPEAALPLEYREGFVFVLVEWAMGSFLCAVAESFPRHQLGERQSTLSVVNFLTQIAMVAHVPATSRSFANAPSLSVSVNPSTPQASERG